MELKATRTYHISISDEDYKRLQERDDSALVDLLDAATRAADGGDLSGTLYLLPSTESDVHEWVGAGDDWPNAPTTYVRYDAEEYDFDYEVR